MFALIYQQACGVDFEVRAYMAMEADNPDEQVDKQWVACLFFSTPYRFIFRSNK